MKKDVVAATAALLVSVSAWSCCGCCTVTGILNAFGIRPPATEKPLPDPAFVLSTPELCEREFGAPTSRPTARLGDGDAMFLSYQDRGVEVMYYRDAGGSWVYTSALEPATSQELTPKEVVRKLHRP